MQHSNDNERILTFGETSVLVEGSGTVLIFAVMCETAEQVETIKEHLVKGSEAHDGNLLFEVVAGNIVLNFSGALTTVETKKRKKTDMPPLPPERRYRGDARVPKADGSGTGNM